MTIRVAIVDDHALARAGFRFMLQPAADIQIVAEGASGEEGLRIARESAPEVMLLDISMPGISGIEVTQRLTRAQSPVRIAIVTMHGEGPLPKLLLDAGASAFLSKDCDSRELIEAVRRLARGERYVAAAIAQRMALSQTGADAIDALTPREFEVALMFGRGMRAIDIGAKLHISEKTVHTYKTRIYDKLGIRSEAELALVLVRHGLIGRD
ncbi:MAG: response regulator transcription factor [Xanthomonadales bacterium]|nr:Response regulator UvrY [Xanthomonadales bacterium]MCC6594456.1 response regulator transcription factor [Xanthomonadales bacterium]